MSVAAGPLVVSEILRRGIAFSSLVLLLTITGHLLYHAGGEDARPVIGTLQWLVGLSSPALLVWHMAEGRSPPAVPSGSRAPA